MRHTHATTALHEHYCRQGGLLSRWSARAHTGGGAITTCQSHMEGHDAVAFHFSPDALYTYLLFGVKLPFKNMTTVEKWMAS